VQNTLIYVITNCLCSFSASVEEFDWGAYLLEGEENVQRFDEESPVSQELL